jgi:hypothetical protein
MPRAIATKEAARAPPATYNIRPPVIVGHADVINNGAINTARPNARKYCTSPQGISAGSTLMELSLHTTFQLREEPLPVLPASREFERNGIPIKI